MKEPLVRTIDVTMPDELGFHLRVVMKFVKCVQRFRSCIHIRYGEIVADGKSILELLVLGAGWKSKLEIKAVGDDAAQAIDEIRDFFLNQESINRGSL